MTEEQNRKIMWLNRAYHAEKKIKSLEALRDKNKDLTDKYEVEFSDSRIDAEILRLKKYRTEISSTIAALHDDDLESVLNLRYLTYNTMQEIADIMAYDRKTIQRKHKTALDRIKL